MKKGIIALIIIIIVILAVIFLGSPKREEKLPISTNMTVTLFLSNEGRSPAGLASIGFVEAVSGKKLSVSFDLDQNGLFDESEMLISDRPISSQADWQTGFYFPVPPSGLENVTRGLVTIDDTSYDVVVLVNTFNADELLDLETVTDPENAMKGLGARVAYAQTDTEISNDGIPDISQKPGECAPTSAANNLIDLVKKNGTPDQQLSDPHQLIEDLKRHMGWTRANGVLPDDFVAGKNTWANANGLPIETRKIGDANGVSTFEAIREALENGDAVELRIKFANPGGTRAIGGHMVTVTGVHVDGDEEYLDINDPATPTGTEQVEIRGNTMADYGPWRGITVLAWGFAQTWTGPSTQDSTGTSVETPKSAVTTEERKTENSTGETPKETTKTEDASSVMPTQPQIEATFAHVKPGEYSEVYAAATGILPGSDVTATLAGPSVMGAKKQTVTADENGVAHFTWKINLYGSYTVSSDYDGAEAQATVDVK